MEILTTRFEVPRARLPIRRMPTPRRLRQTFRSGPRPQPTRRHWSWTNQGSSASRPRGPPIPRRLPRGFQSR